VLHDVETGALWTPLEHLDDARAGFEIRNSPLSENACLGFEYGYAVTAPDALVLWEAQFGDFINGAQVIVDQFIMAGASKWGQRSRLTLLLPHGYEGNGPSTPTPGLDHFLKLAAEDNIRVVNPTTGRPVLPHAARAGADARCAARWS
jgi:2-oxoglutarate dehydrogenase E1 component